MRRDKPSLRQIESFLAVVDAGSFRGAAERSGLSQPTLTAQVAALEKLIGARLFERSRAGTQVSPLGRSLVANARRVVGEVDAFTDAADASRLGPGGTYRLGVTPTLGPYLLPHLLPVLHARYADLRLYVREAAPRDLERGLLEGQHDLLLTALPLGSRELSVETLFREPVKLVMAGDHPLARRSRIEPEDLRGVDVLVIEEHHLFYRQVEQLCERLGANVLRDYEGTSLDTLRHMVVMGMGVAFLPALYVQSEIGHAGAGHTGMDAAARLRVTEIEGEPVYRVHALAWRPASPARTFFRQLADDARDVLRERFPTMVAPRR